MSNRKIEISNESYSDNVGFSISVFGAALTACTSLYLFTIEVLMSESLLVLLSPAALIPNIIIIIFGFLCANWVFNNKQLTIMERFVFALLSLIAFGMSALLFKYPPLGILLLGLLLSVGIGMASFIFISDMIKSLNKFFSTEEDCQFLATNSSRTYGLYASKNSKNSKNFEQITLDIVDIDSIFSR